MKRFSKKIFGFLFLAAICLGSAQAASYSNKTFLMPRAIGTNMAMEYTTWQKILYNNPPENQFGANFQLTGFYQESDNKKDLGKYFGVDHKNKFSIGNSTTDNDIFYRYIFHVASPSEVDPTNATIKFSPDQKAYGVRLDYYQDLSFILKKLYIKANVPFARIENDMDMDISDAAGLFDNHYLEKYFNGRYINDDDEGGNLQTNLRKAKIHGKKSTEGFADVDVVLGYKAFDEERYQLKINLGLTIPTGNKVSGNYVFEPIRGNGRHWGFGGGFDGQVDLYKNHNWTIRLINSFNYRYLFEGQETRTLALNKTFAEEEFQINFSQYYLLGKVSTLTNQNLIPAANILTKSVDITPGNQLEGILSFDFMYKNFVFDLGCDIYFREHEAIELRKNNPFGKNQYGVAQLEYDTGDAFDATVAVENHLLTSFDIDLDAASTPAQFTQKLYAGLGWAANRKEYAALVGIGGSYEFAPSNNELETWALWAKVGVSF